MLWKLINGGAVIIGGSSFLYMLFYVDVSQNTTLVVPFILSVMSMVWGGFALFLQIIYLFLGLTSQKTWRFQRQSLFLSLIVGTHLTLQAFLVWNVFSTLVISVIFIVTEYFLLIHEPQLSK